jgi:hypothetical protein
MSGATHTMRRMWLILLNQRGWWTLEQLNYELRKHHPLLPAVEPAVLDLLATENRLTIRVASGLQTYSVQPDNLALRTITLGDLGLFDH